MKATEDLKIPSSIWALGFVSLLIKSSTVVLYSVTPLFITNVLGVGQATLGLMEGLVEFFSLVTRMISGMVSDYLQKRKLIIAVGYVIALISRPVLALAGNMEMVFLGRSLDRIGNGLDATPRDALVGDLAPSELKGSCYGLRQALGNAGSFVGSGLAILLLWWTANNYASVFWMGIIPAGLALIILLTMVKDPISEKPKSGVKKSKKSMQEVLAEIFELKSAYWWVVIVSFVYFLSNYSTAFVTIMANDLGVPGYLIPITLVIQNVATSAFAYPVGLISDKLSRKSMVLTGFALVVVSNLCMIGALGDDHQEIYGWITTSIVYLFFGIVSWGAELGFTQGMLSAMVADNSQENLRGTAFGIFHLVNGVGFLIANYCFGLFWEEAGAIYSFAFGIVAVITAFLLLLFRRESKLVPAT